VAELSGRNGAVTGVILSDGSRIEADMVLVGVGITPNTQLAAQAGLDVDNGILVDEHLRSSDVNIFAAGDVPNAYNPRLGRHLRVEQWVNARGQEAVAGKTMPGQDAIEARPSYFFTDQYDSAWNTPATSAHPATTGSSFADTRTRASSSSSGFTRNESRPA
jgi:3-phenylpropionate/trans-cinnamate dioxygenase ferredoxin reductase component